MPRTGIRIGDKVRFKGTDFYGKVTGVGHTMIMFDSDPDQCFPDPTALSFSQFIVRLKEPLIVTPQDSIVRQRAPSAFPGSIFIYELSVSAEQLELVS
jgi:hypothetical protein